MYPKEKLLGLDTETHLIVPGLLAPPLVCMSLARADKGTERLLLKQEALEEARAILSGDSVIVGANIAYDFGVLAAEDPTLVDLIFAAYEADRVYDILLAQALDAIAHGCLGMDPRTGGKLQDPETGRQTERYSLAIVADLVLGLATAKKNDFWRERYAILENVPLDQWPYEAVQYPKDDARNTLDVAMAQMGLAPRPELHDFNHMMKTRGLGDRDRVGHCSRCGVGISQDHLGSCPVVKKLDNLHDMRRQARAAWCLHLASMWGLRTDPEHIKELVKRVEKIHRENVSKYTAAGLLRPEGIKGKKAESKDTSALKRMVAEAFGAKDPCPDCAGSGTGISEKTKKPIICTTCFGTGYELAGTSVPRTDKGGVATDRDTLKESGDELLMDFADVSENEKLRGTYIPYLRQGIAAPINPRANVILATGRASYDGLVQLFPRRGGVRESFVAREGYVYGSNDYAGIELCALGQVCLWMVGHSRIAEEINAGKDLHSLFGAQMTGYSYDEFIKLKKAGDKKIKLYRQASKAANFGFGGGMGAVTFVLAKRKGIEGTTVAPDGTVYQGLRFCVMIGGAERCGVEKITEYRGRPCPPVCKHCVELVEQMKSSWLSLFDEMPVYFNIVAQLVDDGGTVVQYVSERIRGGCTFCSGANTGFQGLASEGAKNSLWKVTKECYTDRNSPLWGTRTQIFIHDELFYETPEERASKAARRMADVMVEGMSEVIPDVKVKVEPCLMRRWTKEAEPVEDANGNLIPWEDRPKKAA